MKGFADFAEAVSVPLGLLNMLIGMVAGVWLAVLGRWDLIGYGIVAIIIAGLIAAALARRPGLLLDVPAARRTRGRALLIGFMSFLGSLYRVAVITAWCLAVLYFFAWRAGGNSLVPALVWSYAIAAGPIVWMDQNEIQGGGGRNAAVATLFAQVAYVLVLLAILVYEVALEQGAMLFAAIMGIGLVVLLHSVCSQEAPADPA
jgi:hypothetical protein